MKNDRFSYHRGVARGVLGCPWPPLGRSSFKKTTYNIQVAKTPWQYIGSKSHCWKAHFFKICLFVKYFRQRLLSLVNMGLHAAIIRRSPLKHEGEQLYKPCIVGDPRMVTPPLKNPGYAPAGNKTNSTEPESVSTVKVRGNRHRFNSCATKHPSAAAS